MQRALPWFIPLVVLTAISGVIPVFSGLYHALFAIGTGGEAATWIGGRAFAHVFSDRALLYAFFITTAWAAASTLLTVVWAVPLAVLMTRRRRITTVAVVFLAAIWIVPVFIAAPIWRMFFHGNNGASLFSLLTGVTINLLLDPVGSFAAVLVAAVIRSMPPVVLVLFAGMRKTPRALLDAARVEGATEWQLFRFVHFATIRGYLFLLVVVTLIHAYREFTVPFLMTAGGPPLMAGITATYIVGATTTLEIYLYDLFQFSGSLSVPAAYSTLFLAFFILAATAWFVIRRQAGIAFQAERRVPPRLVTRVAGRTLAQAVDWAWRVLQWGSAVTYAVATLLFIYILIWISVSRVDAIFVDAFLPRFRSLGNFAAILSDPGFFRSLVNSVTIAGATALLASTCAFLAGAAAAIYRLHGRHIFVSLQFFHVSGGMHALIPLFALVVLLGAADRFTPIVLLYAASALPVGFYVVYAFLKEVSESLYDEARMAGAGALAFGVRILLPLCRPALVNVALLAWITAWNGFLIPLVFLNSEARFPTSVYLHRLVGTIASGSPQWGTFAAGSVLNVALLSLLFFASRRPLQFDAMAEIEM